MSYFPEDIPFMSKEELRENGIRIPKDATDTNVGDTISKFIDGLEEIFADLRERHVDDSVCGLCEYDGAYMGQSGDWCNECPGFDRDDCFKLSDKTRKEWTEEIIKALPTIQPEKAQLFKQGATSDLISRQAVINAIENTNAKMSMPEWDEITNAVMSLPTVQPKPKEGHWIPHETPDGGEQYECSRCGVLWEFNDGTPEDNEAYFCPKCGKKLITK